MKLDTIIVQAGGEGTRLEHLTKNKSKAMVPVNNAPILFHLFRKYPDKKFIIIGDYKVEELSNYLDCFATVEFVLIHPEEKGNISGLVEALGYLPENSGFMLIWSDLMLDTNFFVEDLVPFEDGCYVGVSDNFACSWRYDNEANTIEKEASEPTKTSGVAGCFLFHSKKILEQQTVPLSGSFTQFLEQSGLPFRKFSLKESVEVGTLEAIEEVDKSKENRCRPYNHIEMLSDRVIKTALTPEAEILIQRELVWFDQVKRFGFRGAPEVLSLTPLTTRRILGDNLFLVSVPEEEKRQVIGQVVEKLEQLHQLQTGSPNNFDMHTEYYTKTMARLRSISSSIPFASEPMIQINGVACENILVNSLIFREKVGNLIQESEGVLFGLLHGDCTFTNTLMDHNHDIYFIDPRGYFGKSPLVGDVYYDWAKVYYSIEGKFDQFNIKNFDLEIGADQVKFRIQDSGWEAYTPYFLSLIPDCDEQRLKLIHGIIWLSLASHCWEDFDSMCLAFYHGLFLLQDCGIIGENQKRRKSHERTTTHPVDLGENMDI